MGEKEIIDLCQSGKTEYFAQLYEKYIDVIYKFIYLKTFDKNISEDIASMTFLKAIEKIHTFKNTSESNFRAWLYRIAYNQIIDTFKSQKENISIENILEIGYQSDFGQDLDNKEKLKNVFQYFDTLNPRHKQILIMRLWDDLSYKEISEITGENIDNCKKIVSRTLKKIPDTFVFIFLFTMIGDFLLKQL